MTEQQSQATEPRVSATFPEPPADKHYWWGTGRRKTAIARVRVRAGEGKFMVNKRPLEQYFTEEKDRSDSVAPLKATETLRIVRSKHGNDLIARNDGGNGNA